MVKPELKNIDALLTELEKRGYGGVIKEARSELKAIQEGYDKDFIGWWHKSKSYHKGNVLSEILEDEFRDCWQSAINSLPPKVDSPERVCPECKGDGYTAGHDPLDPHENGCSGGCPIQEKCQTCNGTGKTDPQTKEG